MNDERDELAALKKKVEELEAKVSPPKSNFVPKTPEQHRDEMRALSERRMDYATPPSVVRDWAVLSDSDVKGIALRDSRAPQTPATMPPSASRQGGGPANVPGSGTGWAHETPLGPPPGIRYVDQQIDAQDMRDRQELVEKKAHEQALLKAAEGTP